MGRLSALSPMEIIVAVLIFTLVNVYVDLVVFTSIAGTS